MNSGTAETRPPPTAGAHAEAAGALREETEPRAGAVVDLDASDMAVGVGIKLDVVLARRAAVFRHLDEAAGAANAERRGRRRDLHVAGLGDGGGDEGRGALGDVEHAGIVLAAVFIDVGVDGDLRVGLEIEGGGIDEGDAERRIRTGLHDVVEIDVVLDLERRGRVVADHAGAAGHGGDVADRLFRRLLRVGGGRCGRGAAGAVRGCAGAGWACASCTGSEGAAGMSSAFAGILQTNSRSARESRRCITGTSGKRDSNAGSGEAR